MVSITSGISLRYRPCCKNMKTTTNAENLRQYKSSFSLTAEQILAFALRSNLVCEVKNLSQNS